MSIKCIVPGLSDWLLISVESTFSLACAMMYSRQPRKGCRHGIMPLQRERPTDVARSVARCYLKGRSLFASCADSDLDVCVCATNAVVREIWEHETASTIQRAGPCASVHSCLCACTFLRTKNHIAASRFFSRGKDCRRKLVGLTAT